MSINLITLRRVNKKFNEFGMEKATLDDVINLLKEIFGADATHGTEKLRQFDDLLNCARIIVDSKIRLQAEKTSEGLDADDVDMINESEKALDEDLYLFCTTFNGICSSTGVVEYFSNEDRNYLWHEIIRYFYRQEFVIVE